MQPLNETLLNLWFESSEEQAAYAEHRGGRGMQHVRLRDFSIHQDEVDLLEAVPRPTDVPVMPDKVGLSDKVTSSATIFPRHAHIAHACKCWRARARQLCPPVPLSRNQST